jgi:uncharacterized membrane protein
MMRFDHPALLLLGLLLVPQVAAGWTGLRGLDPLRRVIVLGLRGALFALLVLMLAGPRTVREHDRLTVIGLLDVSDSVRRLAEMPADAPAGSRIEFLRRWLEQAVASRRDGDRFGLVVFDGQAVALATPAPRGMGDVAPDLTMQPGTNIAEAVRLGLAMFPGDAARRLLLASDGNQTLGDALEAAREAAAGGGAGVPIDVLPVPYRVTRDVQVIRVEAPPVGRPGQTVTVRILLESTAAASGRLTLRREDQPVDLNGAAPGHSRDITLAGGRAVELAQVVLGETPVNRFEAVFEPAGAAEDELADNNRAQTFTATPQKGKVLLVNGDPDSGGGLLARVLSQADIPFLAGSPEAIPDELLSLQRFDLVILDDVPAAAVSQPQQQALARYVHDLGGGLLMIGGGQSFGAGGWNGSPLEAVLPLELDPPQELILPTAALVLVLDKSGSMNRPVSGARANQQQVANEAAALAIESLRAHSLVGVIAFDTSGHVVVPLQRNADPPAVARTVRGIMAQGGTNLRPALRLARDMLKGVDVDHKRVVCLTDGESPTAGLDELVRDMERDGIRLTTIGVGDDADYDTLARLAEIGGGEFYAVRNPRQLPRVLVDSVRVVNRPLIKESVFSPTVLPTGSSLTAGMDGAPFLRGLVITAPRDEPTAIIEMTHPDGEPLLAHWQAGLGRAAAFTSDAGGPWSQPWTDWPTAAAFWIQLVRATARPAADLQSELVARIEDDRLLVTYEATGGAEGFLSDLVVDGHVYGPDGRATPLRLRQTAPGRYEGSVPAPDSGTSIVALAPRAGARSLAPAIGGASRASNPEFRRLESDPALLEEIRRVTGGRRLALEVPAAVDLFDRAGMARSISSLPAWRGLLWLAIALLLLDVAARRVAWDGRRVPALLALALRRVAPGRVGRTAEATLATLRQASATRQPERPARAAGAPEPAPAPEARRERPATTVARDERSVAAALQALAGRAPAAPEPETEPEPAAGASDGDDRPAPDTTGSLLAARRRKRQRGPDQR